jgi:hypothetical protein
MKGNAAPIAPANRVTFHNRTDCGVRVKGQESGSGSAGDHTEADRFAVEDPNRDDEHRNSNLHLPDTGPESTCNRRNAPDRYLDVHLLGAESSLEGLRTPLLNDAGHSSPACSCS